MAKRFPRRSAYRKSFGRFGGLDKRDRSVVDLTNATKVYNFDITLGALTAGYGVSASEYVPAEARRMWLYPVGKTKIRVYQDGDGRLKCEQSDGQFGYLHNLALTPAQVIPYRLNGKDVLIICCEGRGLIVWDGDTLTEYNSSPKITSMALHYERLFATSRDNPYAVHFSKDLDPTNWRTGLDGGGFIELRDERGMCQKVVSFGGYLYVFREHGISRITAYGEQSEFSVNHLFVTAGRIFSSGIAVCGSVIIFPASDGIYAFDGYNCTRILPNLDGLICPSEGACAAYFDGKYFLSTAMNFADGRIVGCESGSYTNNGLLGYDISSGQYYISRGMDISFMGACDDFLMCCDGEQGGVITKCGARFGVPLKKRWVSGETAFSAPEKIKRIHSVTVDTSAPITIGLHSEKYSKFMAVSGGTVKPYFDCERFSLSVECDAADCRIAPPSIVYSVG